MFFLRTFFPSLWYGYLSSVWKFSVYLLHDSWDTVTVHHIHFHWNSQVCGLISVYKYHGGWSRWLQFDLTVTKTGCGLGMRYLLYLVISTLISFNINLELLSKASDALARNGLPQAVHLDPQARSRDVRLPTSDELFKCIMDENVLGL